MKFILCNNESGKNVINKSFSNEVEFNINLRGDVDIYNLSIRLNNLGVYDFNQFNYAIIEDIGRYYFIDSIKMINTRVYDLILETDVLETYKKDILKSKARYKRGIKEGDYFDIELFKSVNKDIDLVFSNVSLEHGETLLFTTMGVKNG